MFQHPVVGNYFFAITTFLPILVLCKISHSDDSVIKLSNGSPIAGRVVTTVTGKIVTEFLGIPFAEPPVGELRFKPPVRKRSWSTVYQADKLSHSCYQEPDTAFPGFDGTEMWNPNTKMDEDCLYLNVWVPGRIEPAKKLTVMVWIYGGAFMTGSSTLDVYDGKILSSEENIILVSMNYRVTLFGFLYTGGPEAPGNVGLLDQLEAMKWVKEHISNFGGNPDDVTLFGESAGAASVSLHALSPLSQQYFKRFILQSASPTAPWAIIETDKILDHLFEVNYNVSCVPIRHGRQEIDWAAIVACLRTLSPETLIKYQWTTDEFLDFPWRPVVDNYFLIEDPRASVNNGNFKKSEVLLGSNLHEANYFIVYQCFIYQCNETYFKKRKLFTKDEIILSDHDFDQCAFELLPRKFSSNPVVRQAILFEYRDWELPGNALRRQEALDKLIGDYMFTCNVNEVAQKFEHFNSSVYYYYFTHRSSQITWPSWMGAMHGYEINFVFGEPLNGVKYNYTKEEKDLAKRFMRYWANFARSGNPNINPDNSWNADQWPQYGKLQNYMILTVNSSKVETGLRRKACAFWKNYIPKLKIATASITETEVRWKQHFSKWHDDYFVEWQHQLEKYQRLNQYTHV